MDTADKFGIFLKICGYLIIEKIKNLFGNRRKEVKLKIAALEYAIASIRMAALREDVAFVCNEVEDFLWKYNKRDCRASTAFIPEMLKHMPPRHTSRSAWFKSDDYISRIRMCEEIIKELKN